MRREASNKDEAGQSVEPAETCKPSQGQGTLPTLHQQQPKGQQGTSRSVERDCTPSGASESSTCSAQQQAQQ